MKLFITVVALFVVFPAIAQNDALEKSFANLSKALIEKDTITLKQLINDDVSYGHSNGWLETKQDIIKDLFSGVISYTKIENSDIKWIINDSWASVRCKTKLGYVMDNEAGEINLRVLQVWVKTINGWQLIARQGVRSQ